MRPSSPSDTAPTATGITQVNRRQRTRLETWMLSGVEGPISAR